MRSSWDRCRQERPDIASGPAVFALANAFEPVQDGRVYIEKITGRFCFSSRARPAEYKAGLDHAIAKSWLWLHESGTYVRLTETGAALLA